MPVIQIRALPQQPGVDVATTMKRSTAVVAELMKAPPQAVFCTWETIPAGQYVEGDRDASVQPRNTHPPQVSLLAFEGRTSETIEKTLEALADVLCEGLRLERGNAFISFNEVLSGRIYTGGKVKRRT
jgi:phenylpyruvate tautomerase PptA (4-oxalocrotonate tautomerase family)